MNTFGSDLTKILSAREEATTPAEKTAGVVVHKAERVVKKETEKETEKTEPEKEAEKTEPEKVEETESETEKEESEE